jgi:hypothetical protein
MRAWAAMEHEARVTMRQVWIVDNDPLVREAVAEDLEDRALPAVVMTEAHLRRELDDGQRPDGLLIDEEVLGHARDLVAAMGDIARVVLAATAANVEPELGSGIEAQVRVVDKRELGDVAAAVRWLHRATDDDRWALAATLRSDQR